MINQLYNMDKFFAYSMGIQKATLTTNAIESLNSSHRKATQNDLLSKPMIQSIKFFNWRWRRMKIWTIPIRDWSPP